MTLVVVTNGDQVLLNTGLAFGNTLSLRLYTNNITPSKSDLLATYTQASGSGYAAISMPRGSWVFSNTGAGGNGNAQYPAQSWTFTGAITVYGYYIVDSSSGLLMWAERFAGAPLTFAAAGVLTITPYIEAN